MYLRLLDFIELTKPRITFLALSMAALGYWLGKTGPIETLDFALFLAGLGLIGGASGVLNQVLERDIDSRMWRTLHRPIPSGRVRAESASKVGLSFALLGELILLIFVNPMTAVLAAVTLFIYLGVYTPSKRVSSLSTLIGAIPGAMPPLMGWTAARGTIGIEGVVLFAILFLWQIPHFLAIGWLHREDYARAHLPILSVVDSEGLQMSKQVILYSLVLLPLTLVPYVWKMAGHFYLWGALLLGLVLIILSGVLAVRRTRALARSLFIYSVFYLPLLGLIWIWNRTY